MKYAHKAALATGSLLLAVVIMLAPHGTAAQSYSLAPVTPSVAAGQTIHFGAAGLQPGERLSVWATAPDQSVIGGRYVFVSRSGDAVISFDVPSDALSGKWALTIYGINTQTPVVTYFDVSGRPPEATRTQATAWPGSVAAGEPVSFAAFGFKKSERVSYWVTGPDNRIYAAFPSAERANDDGRIDFIWTTGPDSPPGTYVMTMQGLKSGIARGVPFEVRSR